MSGRIVAGEIFGRLTVLEDLGTDHGYVRRYRCRCSCGAEKIIRHGGLRGGTQSCGCLHAEATSLARRRHGKAGGPVYKRWAAMLRRCRNPSDTSYANYGGRGIAVCERWQIFEGFYADMGDPPAGMTLDRVDNDGPYSPENCRWASRTTQGNNQRKTVMLEYQGQIRSVAAWAADLGLPGTALHDRIRRGWSVERVVTTPRQSEGRHRRIQPALIETSPVARFRRARRPVLST